MIREGLLYHLGGTLFTAKPRMIQFPVTDRCNARCIMCNRWQKNGQNEMSIDKIREVFSNGLFAQVEDVSLHGGEPTLRRDLAEIVKIMQQNCPKLNHLWISTNGFGTKRVKKRIEEIFNVINFDGVQKLDVNVSIDGIGDCHDKIRGIKGGFDQCVRTVEMITDLSQSYPIQVTIGTVIQPLNIHQIDQLEGLAEKLGVPINFQPLMFDKFFNILGDQQLRFSENQVREFKKIIQTKLESGLTTTNFYWCRFLSMMEGAERRMPCAFDRYVFSLYPTGEVLPCSREDWIVFGNVHEEPVGKIWFGQRAKMVRNKMKKETCPTCSFYCGVEFSLQKEFFAYLGFFLKKSLSKN